MSLKSARKFQAVSGVDVSGFEFAGESEVS
jgi:hypothetical protein